MLCREAFFSFGRTLHLWMGVWIEQEMIQPYFNMACSFSSSSFWRAITARIIFLSSSVRWLKSGMSGIEADTEARGPPWGPTEAAMFLPPPSLPPFLRRASYWRYRLRPRSALPYSISCLPTIELLSPFVRCLPTSFPPYLVSCSLLALFQPPTPTPPSPRLSPPPPVTGSPSSLRDADAGTPALTLHSQIWDVGQRRRCSLCSLCLLFLYLFFSI